MRDEGPRGRERDVDPYARVAVGGAEGADGGGVGDG